MRPTLQRRCELFLQNRDVIKSALKMESNYVYPVCANIFTARGICASAEQLKQCKKLVNESTGVFSNFRGLVKLPLITMLAVSDRPEQEMDRIKKLYGKLKSEFPGSEFLALTAAAFADRIPEEKADDYTGRARAIYRKMQKEHPFLTSKEDSLSAVSLSLTEKTEEQIVNEMEESYTMLKKEFHNSNAIQSVAQVLCLTEGNCAEKCARFAALYHGLEQGGRKYGKNYELGVLAALTLLNDSVESMMEDILAVDDYLSGQKGYGLFGLDKKTRLLHAAILVMDERADEETLQNASTTWLTGTLAMLITQQVVAATAAASSAAAVNANN